MVLKLLLHALYFNLISLFLVDLLVYLSKKALFKQHTLKKLVVQPFKTFNSPTDFQVSAVKSDKQINKIN